jgi:hypothetical protein
MRDARCVCLAAIIAASGWCKMQDARQGPGKGRLIPYKKTKDKNESDVYIWADGH